MLHVWGTELTWNVYLHIYFAKTKLSMYTLTLYAGYLKDFGPKNQLIQAHSFKVTVVSNAQLPRTRTALDRKLSYTRSHLVVCTIVESSFKLF